MVDVPKEKSPRWVLEIINYSTMIIYHSIIISKYVYFVYACMYVHMYVVQWTNTNCQTMKVNKWLIK